MTDNYIDQDETQIYGPYAAKMMRARIIGQIVEFDSALEKVAGELEHATAAVHEAIETSRDASANLRAAARDKGPALKRASSLLGRFSTHLDAHPKGTVDRRRFFPEDGTATGIGKGAPRVAIALARIATQLARPECPVNASDEWLKEFKAASRTLSPQLEHANNAKTERADATPELEVARQAWSQVYIASKCAVECVLRLTGNLHLMPVVFHDLAVPANTKVTSIPEPPAEPTPVNPG